MGFRPAISAFRRLAGLGAPTEVSGRHRVAGNRADYNYASGPHGRIVIAPVGLLAANRQGRGTLNVHAADQSDCRFGLRYRSRKR
jgi:hypothetical protein